MRTDTGARSPVPAGRRRNDLTIYERHAGDWWDEHSPAFASLHALTTIRLETLHRWVGPEITAGRCLIDLGCGGGLLSEPLAGLGARVLGLDLSGGSVRTAREHAARDDDRHGSRLPVHYLQADLTRTPLPDACADGVLLADVIEHLPEPEQAVAEAARLLKAGGWLYVNTINRTWRARLLAVHLAEGAGLIPRGTHDPNLFVRPTELDDMASAHGLSLAERCGESPLLWQTLRRWALRLRASRSVAVAYSSLYRKPPVSSPPVAR